MNKLSGLRSILQRKALFFKILLSYIVSGSILLSILSYMMYDSYSKNALKEIDKNAEKMLNQSFNVVETYWSSTLTYLGQFHVLRNVATGTGVSGSLEYAPVYDGLYSDSFDGIRMGAISKKLADIAASNPIIESVYIYNKRAGLVFSNVNVSQPIGEFVDRDIVDIVEKHPDANEISYAPRKVHYQWGTNTVDYNTISIIFIEDYIDRVPASVLVFNLRQSALQQIVMPDNVDETSQIFIIDKNGLIISHPQMELVDRNIANEPYIRSILSSNADSGSFSAEVNGGRSLVTYKKSYSPFGWTFVSVGDYKKLLWNYKKLRETIALLAAAFVLISILIAVFFTSNMYKPLRRLLRKLRSGSASDPGGKGTLGEYDYLNSMFDYLMKNVNDLEASVRSGLPAIRAETLKKVLLGSVTSESELADNIAKLNIRLGGPAYVVCLLRICSFRELQDRLSARDLALFRFALMNIAAETFATDAEVEVVDADTDHIGIIVNVPDRDNEALLKALLMQTQHNVKQYLNIAATAAIGSFAGRRQDIHRSYADALRSSDYRLVYGKTAIISHADIQSVSREPYHYPIEIEKKLLDALKAADAEKTYEALDDMLSHVRHFTYDEILLSLTQLALSSLVIASDETEDGQERIRLSYKTINEQLSGCDDLSDVRNWFVPLLDRMLTLFRAKRDNKNKDIVDKLMDYVHAHYRDAGLTVEDVSEHVRLSPNYVRTIFKNTTGTSLSTYIGELRFAEARRLLLESDDHANKIADQIGFANTKYFYSAFKKATGYTPDEFRRKFR